jgi:hypothetical protein
VAGSAKLSFSLRTNAAVVISSRNAHKLDLV